MLAINPALQRNKINIIGWAMNWYRNVRICEPNSIRHTPKNLWCHIFVAIYLREFFKGSMVIGIWATAQCWKVHLELVIYSLLTGNVSIESLNKFGKTTYKCLVEYGIKGPTMGDHSLQLQESFPKVNIDERSANAIREIPERLRRVHLVEHCSSSHISDGTNPKTNDAYVYLMDYSSSRIHEGQAVLLPAELIIQGLFFFLHTATAS
ncbi:hypothetical protein IEQ34_002254 [Dendrobium chrysotoxum]|uniref:Uncharacterized protein n=1 Tax=Dendrobium chrysotoxum TaxID=161865 RepID=A0AAV7HMY1_DENCH|nr:hypothetical protein IEQ34_002254 [Dendrobium chrysotoxum]